MTEEGEFDVMTRFEFALLERLQQFELTDEELAKEAGLPLNRLVDRSGRAPTEFDTERIHAISRYLMAEEELDHDFDTTDEREHVISIGMFIYGFMDWGLGLGSEADHG